jgi:hypothetical protein
MLPPSCADPGYLYPLDATKHPWNVTVSVTKKTAATPTLDKHTITLWPPVASMLGSGTHLQQQPDGGQQQQHAAASSVWSELSSARVADTTTDLVEAAAAAAAALCGYGMPPHSSPATGLASILIAAAEAAAAAAAAPAEPEVPLTLERVPDLRLEGLLRLWEVQGDGGTAEVLARVVQVRGVARLLRVWFWCS